MNTEKKYHLRKGEFYVRLSGSKGVLLINSKDYATPLTSGYCMVFANTDDYEIEPVDPIRMVCAECLESHLICREDSDPPNSKVLLTTCPDCVGDDPYKLLDNEKHHDSQGNLIWKK